MSEMESILSRNLSEVKRRIADACRRVERQPHEVTLVAVTKYVDANIVRVLQLLGVTDFGESRPQELWKKAAAVSEAQWHLVGHLQRNKIAKTLPLVRLIHSVDSIRLLEAIEAEAAEQGRNVDVLLEFNLSGEAAKHGFLSELALIPKAVETLRFIRVVGLMAMAPLVEKPEQARPVFVVGSRMRDFLRETLPEPHVLKHLSMGMTNDFEVAIEEGATIVRIGTALFRGLEGIDS
jgi:pyridoxal phosphate enzyme (YggS family)